MIERKAASEGEGDMEEASAAVSELSTMRSSSSNKDSDHGSSECNSSSSSTSTSSTLDEAVVHGPAMVPWLCLPLSKWSRVSFSDHYPEDGGLALLKVLLELLLLLWPNQQVRIESV